MPLHRIGDLSALACAGTCSFGRVQLFTVRAQARLGSDRIDAAEVVWFPVWKPALMILWNTVISVVNALARAVLVVGLAHQLQATSPNWGNITMAFGLIWTSRIVGLGMLAHKATERIVA